MKRYAVKEIYSTIQGEGSFVGCAIILVRFAGCNVWSGLEKDRERDAAKGECARYCDTDFVGTDGKNGGSYTAAELKVKIESLWPGLGSDPVNARTIRIVLFTGGEPSLQLDTDLTARLRSRWKVHVETNGHKPLPTVDHVTLSPKPPLVPCLQRYDAVKVVYPGGIDPEPYYELAPSGHAFIQPVDWSHVPTPSYVSTEESLHSAVEYVKARPWWRISLQQHKLLNIP